MVKCDPKAFAKCPTRHLCGTPEDATFAPGSDCDKFNQRVLLQPMTNADRVRAMSDDDLAYWIMCPYDSPFCDGTEHNCIACTKEWLQQPAEEG